MNVYTDYRGRVILETADPSEAVPPERAEALAMTLLEAAREARRRTSCTAPAPDPARGAPVGPEDGPQSASCACGSTVMRAVGASDWKHDWEIFK